MIGTTVRFGSLALTLAAFALAPSPAGAQIQRELTKQEQAVHVLSRLTFGARPGELQRVMKLGVDPWIEQQLRPSSLSDSVAVAALSSLRAWTLEPKAIPALAGQQPQFEVMMRMDAEVSAPPGRQIRPLSFTSPSNEFVAGKIIRAQFSERQLEEMMVDFWLNHFSVFSGKMPSVEAIVAYERDVIRPRALGKFRDLVGAVAHSPAMLFYLDNQQSRSDSLHQNLIEFRAGTTPQSRSAAIKRLGINENYARELLELHSLGVDGGYTQNDVIEVARAFTGWTSSIARPALPGGARVPASFAFVEEMHDAESKTVLGHTLVAGRGVEDGEQVLDIIAKHPSTARFVATKLARRFVSDAPPQALIDRAAATFSRTDGDITETLRTIVTSSEFFSRAAFRTKIKTPFEFVVGVRRALNAPADTSEGTARAIAQLGQPTLGRETPDGWPDNATSWMNAFALMNRITFVHDVAAGRLTFLPTAGWDGWKKFAGKALKPQVDGVIAGILNGVASSETQDYMLALPEPKSVAPGGKVSSSRLRELLTIALASPEFQRR